LQSLPIGAAFDQTLEGVTFPSSLQSLTFGAAFDRNLEDVTFPKGLQSLTSNLRTATRIAPIGDSYNQNTLT